MPSTPPPAPLRERLGDREALRRVAAEPLVGLGAGRALLMQLAHPEVARGVAEHSDFAGRPLARLFGTLDFLLIVTFGTPDEVERFAARIRGLHRRIRGEGYSGADPALQAWVNATLIDSALHVYRHVMRPGADEPDLSDDYHRQARLVAEVLDVPPGLQPAGLADFRAYVDGMTSSLEVSDTAREVARAVLWPARLRWPAPALWVFRLVTTALLPPPLREQYGLPWGRGRARLADLVLRAATDLYHFTPGFLRRPPRRLLVRLATHRVNAAMRHSRRRGG
ncbi:oxygenase MpaB family protein [Spirillospora sp. CA-253888]